MHEFRVGVAGRCHERSVDLVGEKLVDARVPLVDRSPIDSQTSVLEEVRPAHRQGDVLGDRDASSDRDASPWAVDWTSEEGQSASGAGPGRPCRAGRR